MIRVSRESSGRKQQLIGKMKITKVHIKERYNNKLFGAPSENDSL
jgi:hypothetical protein